MVIIKTPDEIKKLQEGGPILAKVLKAVAKACKPGITTASLDKLAFDLIKKAGGTPAFLGYRPEGAKSPFPASLCVSINNEVVHGIPSERVIEPGDMVSLDLGLNHKGVFLDHAVTVAVGKVSKVDKLLMEKGLEALEAGVKEAKVGNTTGDIGFAIESVIKPHRFGIIRTFSGHGVGRYIHEDPYVPNYGRPGKGEKLRVGMVIAIEPMITLGGEAVRVAKDGYTVITTDGSRAVHFEHTVLITDKGPKILTK